MAALMSKLSSFIFGEGVYTFAACCDGKTMVLKLSIN